VEGLCVTDASALPAASGVNPMLSILALARRTARRMAARWAGRSAGPGDLPGRGPRQAVPRASALLRRFG
jgi:choline dehydrogenase-like flavoprotein